MSLWVYGIFEIRTSPDILHPELIVTKPSLALFLRGIAGSLYVLPAPPLYHIGRPVCMGFVVWIAAWGRHEAWEPAQPHQTVDRAR